MTKPKFTPNPDDLQSIKRFLGQISWGDECTVCTKLDGSLTYLLSDLCLWVPCPYTEFEQNIDRCKALANQHGVKPGFIFSGDAPKIECDRISWQATREDFVVQWLEPSCRVQYARFLTRALDGIEWWKPENWNMEEAGKWHTDIKTIAQKN